jgi:DNA-binding LacI/PurR family transcriptional regulator
MQDVAKRAGVALSTVSYALNGTRPISEETRLRILVAMDELGYHPNLLARSLSTKRTHIIGLFIPSDVHGSLPVTQAGFVASAARAASARGYGLLLWDSPERDFDVRRIGQEGMVEGLILMEVKLHDERVARLRASDYPFSLIGHCADNTGLSFVDFDFAAAAQLAVQHLADLGHRCVALLNYTDQVIASGYGPAVRLTEGFVAGASAHSVDSVLLAGNGISGELVDLVIRHLRTEPRLTAFIVSDFSHLAAVTQAAHKLRLRIPNDLSVVSILEDYVAEKVAPPLTNINLPAETMGRLGAELLIDQLETSDSSVRQLLLSPQLHRGQSTAGPRDRATRRRLTRTSTP